MWDNGERRGRNAAMNVRLTGWLIARRHHIPHFKDMGENQEGMLYGGPAWFVPRSRLAEVRQALPGLNGPTVVDIMNSGAHVAVHAVVPAKEIYRVVSELRALDAEGILVTRIERLMP